MARERLTVVIIVKNEEGNIRGCLESVKWADEIVIVDDNSTDKTITLARQYTDKIIVSDSGANLSKQRNIGIDHATGDWILQMDADERVTSDLKDAISKMLESCSRLSAFRFKRLNNFCGKFLQFGGEGLHKPLRLFRKGRANFLMLGNRIHEEIKIDGQTGEIDAIMEHYNFPSLSHYVNRQDFYSGVEAKDLSDKIGILPEKRLRKELTIVPLKLFFKIYIKRKGYRDGPHGLIFAALSAWRRFLIYAKYWELNKDFYDKAKR